MVSCVGNLFCFTMFYVFLQLVCQITDVVSVNADVRQKRNVKKVCF